MGVRYGVMPYDPDNTIVTTVGDRVEYESKCGVAVRRPDLCGVTEAIPQEKHKAAYRTVLIRKCRGLGLIHSKFARGLLSTNPLRISENVIKSLEEKLAQATKG